MQGHIIEKGHSKEFWQNVVHKRRALERLILKLKLQYFGHLMWRTDSLEKTLMLGKIVGKRRGDDREWDGWMASWVRWTWVWASSGSWWWTGRPGVLQTMRSQRVVHNWATELKWPKVSGEWESLALIVWMQLKVVCHWAMMLSLLSDGHWWGQGLAPLRLNSCMMI